VLKILAVTPSKKGFTFRFCKTLKLLFFSSSNCSLDLQEGPAPVVRQGVLLRLLCHRGCSQVEVHLVPQRPAAQSSINRRSGECCSHRPGVLNHLVVAYPQIENYQYNLTFCVPPQGPWLRIAAIDCIDKGCATLGMWAKSGPSSIFIRTVLVDTFYE
jgi:hypothetical protein